MSTTNAPLFWEPPLFLFFLFYFVVALVIVGHECSGLHYLLHKISSSSLLSSLADQCHTPAVEKLSVSAAVMACLLEGSCNILGHWTTKQLCCHSC